MSHVLLLPFGTSGSVYPFIWLGKKLIERGHQVTMIASPAYEDSAVKAELGFLSPAIDFLDALLEHPSFLKAGEGTKLAFEFAGRAAGPCAAAVERVIVERGKPDLILAPLISFGARLVREKHRIPLVTVHLHPAALMSAHEIPLIFPAIRWLRLLPLWARKAILALPSPYDEHAMPHLRLACADNSVQAPSRIWKTWDQSPDGVLALFPSWYAEPQPDWPHNHFQWGFPLEDMAKEKPLSADVLRFLDAGEKPIVFTPGTGHRDVRRFFELASATVRELNCRAIFATSELGQLPPKLPESVLCVKYAPFGALFSRSSALVHPGGIGTLSQALASGIPQIIIPLVNDQHDNAERIERLRVGTQLSNRGLTSFRLSVQITKTLTDTLILQNAKRHAELIKNNSSSKKLLDWLESRCTSHLLAS